MEKLMCVSEVAGILGVPPGTVYKWIYKKQIPVIYAGRCPRFRPSEIEAWLSSSSPKKEPRAPEKIRKTQKGPRNSEIDRIIQTAKNEVLS